MKYRIRDVENFVAACSCSTMTEAAEKLEISQPALSESIQRLEADLSSTLFYRSRSGIQLTPNGRVLLGRARQALQSFEDLDFAKSTCASFGDREISIGCHVTVAQYFLPKFLVELKKTAPDYKLEIRHGLSRHIQTEIQRGKIDIGIVVNPVSVPDIIIKRLAFDSVAIWSSPSTHDYDTVLCNSDLVQTQSILRKWKKNKPGRLIHIESLELICRMVDEGVGYGIIPERLVRLLGLDLKKMTAWPSYTDQFCLVYRPEFGKFPCEKLIIDALTHQVN